MIKINFSVMLLALVFCSFEAHAQSSEDLFKKIFGNAPKSKTIAIDATLKDFFLGRVSVTVVGETITSLSGEDLDRLLIDKIRDERKSLYTFGHVQVDPNNLPFKVTYLPADLRLVIDIPDNDLKSQDTKVFEKLIPYFARKSVNAAPFSFGTNYKLEEVQNSNLNQPSFFQAYFDSFMNIRSIAVENQMDYSSDGPDGHSTGLSRKNSKLIYDRPNDMQRLEIGDVNFPIIGHQQATTMGGISFYRDFSLDPYRYTGVTSSFEYQVDTRSLVKTYVNYNMVKSEYMNPGRYSLKDVPLNNGLNKIMIEMTDEMGKKKIVIFNTPGSIDLLAPGLSRYSFAIGYPSQEIKAVKKYEEQNGALVSGFYQYGMNKYWGPSGYFQGNKNYSLVGFGNTIATQYGNWFLDVGGSQNRDHAGPVIQGSYQLNLFGQYWYDTHTFTTRVEYRSPWFNEIGENIRNRFDFLTSSSYSIPLFEKMNLAIGENYQSARSGNMSKFGIDTSLTIRPLNATSLTFYYSRSRDENQLWSTQLYFFLNMSFGENNTIASAFYEKTTNDKRINVMYDTGKQVNNLQASASIDDNKTSSDESLDLQYNTVLADLGIREEVMHTQGKGTGLRSSLRFLSAFAYVDNGDNDGFSISRPISNSFVIFKPNSAWKDQRFGVQSSGGTEAESGLFGESLISGLNAYQYRQLQLDPRWLGAGYSLGQESFVVYPGYRSGNLFVVGQSGTVLLKGILLDEKKNIVPLKVGFWTATSSSSGKTIPFFTGREGEFFIEGVEPTGGKIQLDGDRFKTYEVHLKKQQTGLVDLGSITLEPKENFPENHL